MTTRLELHPGECHLRKLGLKRDPAVTDLQQQQAVGIQMRCRVSENLPCQVQPVVPRAETDRRLSIIFRGHSCKIVVVNVRRIAKNNIESLAQQARKKISPDTFHSAAHPMLAHIFCSQRQGLCINITEHHPRLRKTDSAGDADGTAAAAQIEYRRGLAVSVPGLEAPNN